MTDDAMERALAEAYRAYHQKLKGEAERLRYLLAQYSAGQSPKSELKHFLHRLAGTSGTYELHEVSQTARRAEDLLDKNASPGELQKHGEKLIELMNSAA